jgi:hypothetical protein
VVADRRPLSEIKMHGGHLTFDNVRLAHLLCNQRDYIWRKKINALLGKRMSLEEIAEQLNAEKVPTIHGTNRWTAVSVRKAFVSWKRAYMNPLSVDDVTNVGVAFRKWVKQLRAVENLIP